MTKSEQRAAANAARYAAAGHSDIAARTLAALHRSASRRSQETIARLIDSDTAIRGHLDVVNGCYVEKVAA
jgi:hypothetical protein